MKATIYHNPDCDTSRNTLIRIRHDGIGPMFGGERLAAGNTGDAVKTNVMFSRYRN